MTWRALSGRPYGEGGFGYGAPVAGHGPQEMSM